MGGGGVSWLDGSEVEVRETVLRESSLVEAISREMATLLERV